MKWRFDKQTVLLENLEIASKKQLFTSVFNSASVLAIWHPNPGGFSCKPVRVQGLHPEGQCDCKPGQILAHLYKISP